ncbi:UNVERIFIED_ORG: hypothetical protein FHT06_001080 [Xanthomonas campestris]|uniref:hypothetical protein n=1 Tax=Xanthomonas arboricola TaxID=56448 RepID=UPI0016B4B978
MDAYVGFAQQIVTWLLVVVGWLVLSDQAERREIAKSYFSRLQQLREDLKKLEEDGRLFHAGDYDEALAQRVARAERRLSVELSNLKSSGVVRFSLTQEAIRLRQALTARNFDRSSHEQQSWESGIQLEIAAAVDVVDRALFNAAHQIATTPISLRSSLRNVFRHRF